MGLNNKERPCKSKAFLSIQRPPVVKQTPVVVALLRQIWTLPHPFAGIPFDPPLAVTVLGILDVFPRMEQGPTLKVPVNIASVGIVPSTIDDSQKKVVFPHLHPPAVSPAALVAHLAWSRGEDGFNIGVQFEFCHVDPSQIADTGHCMQKEIG